MDLPYILSKINIKAIAGIVLLGAVIWLIVYLVKLFMNKLGENENLKYEFITIIAHKFRTPLTQLKWIAETLLADEKDSFKRESLLNMQKSTKGLIDLTGTLIELTDSDSKSAYNFERIAISSMVRSVGSYIKNSFKEKNIYFAIQAPPEDIFIKADSIRMEFVFNTILTNAYTYTPPGRDVNVVIELVGKNVVISIIDKGIGIETKDIPHLFTKFYRTDIAKRTDTEGFGVGLYMAKAVVQRHHGKIEVSSEGLNKGTTFRVLLPVVK